MSSQNYEKTVTVQLGLKIKKYPVKEKKNLTCLLQMIKKSHCTFKDPETHLDFAREGRGWKVGKDCPGQKQEPHKRAGHTRVINCIAV